MIPRRFDHGAGQQQCQQPDADLQDEREQRCVGVEHAGKDRPQRLASLGIAAHAPLMAGVLLLRAFRLEGFVQQGAVRTADEGQGDPEQDLGGHDMGEGGRPPYRSPSRPCRAARPG